MLDQKSAQDFYVNKLGFKVNTDAEMGEKGRWLTVNPPDQPDVELTPNPDDEYIVTNDKPKLENLRCLFADLYR